MLTSFGQPRNAVSPNAVSPTGGDLEENPFEAEFHGEANSDSEEIDDGLDFTPPFDPYINNFAVLDSSLPLPEQLPEPHHLASYVSAKRSGRNREKKQQKTRWHFGIRSRSPPMEVMLEIYRTLKTLGMEWKEKKNLGGLGGVRSGGKVQIEKMSELDGPGPPGVDLKAASSIYFVETRARSKDVVVGFLSNVGVIQTDDVASCRF
jgi:carbon catabolite-derepressing protein kinase